MNFRKVFFIADGTTLNTDQLQILRQAASKHTCYINVKEGMKFKFDFDSNEIIDVYFTFC